MILSFFLSILLLVSPAFTADGESLSARRIAGSYSVKGTKPDGLGEYSGSVVIQRTGSAYRVFWNVGGEGYIGTGILTDDVLSVVYSDAGSRSFGVAAYRIIDNGNSLSGQWTTYSGEKLGKEILTKAKSENLKSNKHEKTTILEL